MTKKSRLCLFFLITLLCSEIAAQSEFNLLFNFATSSSEEILIESQLFDYDNDSIDDYVFIFKDKSIWKLTVFNKDGVQLKNVTDTISVGASLKHAKLFSQGNNIYLALLSKILSEEVEREIKFRLEIIDVERKEIVDTAEGYTWDFHYGTGWYESLNLISLDYIKIDSTSGFVSMGWEYYNEYTDIGETSGTEKEQHIFLFKFNGQIEYYDKDYEKVALIENCAEILKYCNLGWGGRFHQANGVWGSNYTNEAYISKIDFSQPRPTNYTLTSLDFYNPNMLASDDSTNLENGIVFYRESYSWPSRKKILYSYSFDSSKVMWSREDERFQIHPITASANLSMENQNYLCYFSDYTMQIIERNTGELVHYELSSISPIEILTAENNNELFFVSKSGLRTINIYKLNQINFVITDIKELNGKLVPNKFYLFQNYPNPFNPSTIISYSIPTSSVISNPQRDERSQNIGLGISSDGRNDNVNVILNIFDILGRKIGTLVNEKQSPGNYEVVFDASDLPSGIYFYSLEAGKYRETRKMILLK